MSLSFCIFSWCHFNDFLSCEASWVRRCSEIIPSRPGLMKHGVLHCHIEKRGASGLQLKAVRSIIHLLIPEVERNGSIELLSTPNGRTLRIQLFDAGPNMATLYEWLVAGTPHGTKAPGVA